MKCSFCGKHGKKVAILIKGDNVFICNECVFVCNNLISQDILERIAKVQAQLEVKPEPGCKCHIEPSKPWPRTSGGYQPYSFNTLGSEPPKEE